MDKVDNEEEEQQQQQQRLCISREIENPIQIESDLLARRGEFLWHAAKSQTHLQLMRLEMQSRPEEASLLVYLLFTIMVSWGSPRVA
ncbi:hypothetical protein DAPPUDRAFT_252338 [Daphnia pulex]|uniref:Uncharacterized protein n=1 Tax=Daphnia pulex TaxID=6669 RepID=E9H2I2_DAPPU|nr:hypothetical protein DAPPUDRAFT_252338 [Daphnia pulex]|eukprot:EFX74062.1 hypothetical protein DAPPUDRAFT_252338 [Daphnia pulex]